MKNHDSRKDFIVNKLPLFKDPRLRVRANESAMAYEPTSKVLAIGFGSYKYGKHERMEKDALQLWDLSELNKPHLIEEYDTERHCFNDLRFSPDGKYLAAAMSDRRLNLWRLSDGLLELVASFTLVAGATELSWRSDSKFLAASTWEGYVAVLDIASMELRYLDIVEDTFWSISWRPDGKIIAVGSNEGYLMFVDPDNGDVLFKEIWHDELEARNLRWSPDGRFLVFNHAWWFIFVREDGELLGSISVNTADDIEISPDGNFIAATYIDHEITEEVVGVFEARREWFGEQLYEDAPPLKRWPFEGAFDVEWLDNDKLAVLDTEGKLSIISTGLTSKRK